MSYILDALRRAQAERERGQVPGLHAQPGLGGGPRMRAATAGPAARPAWLWALGGAALVALVLVPWLLLTRGGGGPQAAAPAGAVAVQQPAPTGSPPEAQPLVVVSANSGAAKVSGAPAATVAATAAPRLGVAPAPAAANVSAPSASPVPRQEAQPAPSGQVAQPAPGAVTPGLTPAPGGASAAAADTPAAPAAPVAAAAATPVPANSTAARSPVSPATLPPMLTAEQRREWPALSLGGSVWSETPTARFVILGGQVVREGDSTPDGVLVERITPKAVVLRWRDQRAALPF